MFKFVRTAISTFMCIVNELYYDVIKSIKYSTKVISFNGVVEPSENDYRNVQVNLS